MTAVQKYDLPNWFRHSTVCVKNCIIVFGGDGKRSLRNIYIYNLYTEQWRKYVIPDDEVAPPKTVSCCALTMEKFVYIFGGFVFKKNRIPKTNAVWKLTTTQGQSFIWSKTRTRSRNKTPSPRVDHSCWVYLGKLWTFGGNGDDPAHCLNENGDRIFMNMGMDMRTTRCIALTFLLRNEQTRSPMELYLVLVLAMLALLLGIMLGCLEDIVTAFIMKSYMNCINLI